MYNAAYIIFIMWNSISGLDAWYYFRFNISCGVAVTLRSHQIEFQVIFNLHFRWHLHFLDHLHFYWSPSFLRSSSFLRFFSSICSMSRRNLLFTASKSVLKYL